MDIVVNGRQLTISDSFRAHIEDKIILASYSPAQEEVQR